MPETATESAAEGCRPAAALVLAGRILAVAALIVNPWVAGRLAGAGLAGKLLLLVAGASLAGYAVHALRAAARGESLGSWLSRCHAFAAAQVFHFVLLFVLANAVAALVKRPPAPDVHLTDLYLNPEQLYHEDRDFLRRRVYPGRTDEEILELIQPPGSLHHPTLEYVAPVVASKHYNIGFEGVRLDASLKPEEVPELLRGGAVWLFGGSTMFGANISDNETVSAHLNVLAAPLRHLNFGVPSYHQNLEIDKLLLLLRKGYRPQKVVFLDGWNDLTALRSGDFHPVEMPAKSIHAYGSLCSIDKLRDGNAAAVLRRLPAIDLLFRWQEAQLPPVAPSLDARGFENLFDPRSSYRAQPLRHYDWVRARQFDHATFLADLDRHKMRLAAYYRSNDDFLGRLARAYGFEVHVFLQPMGSLSEANPFLREGARLTEHPYYQSTRGLIDHARALVRDGELAHFHDLTQAAGDNPTGFVDAAHYDSATCRAIAQAMLPLLSRTPPTRP